MRRYIIPKLGLMLKRMTYFEIRPTRELPLAGVRSLLLTLQPANGRRNAANDRGYSRMLRFFAVRSTSVAAPSRSTFKFLGTLK